MASKSKSRRRVLRASCLLAALIVAGSSFAWFTSKDEVTNRLSASGDYDVTIAEDFTPPAQWLPGQKVDKNVGAVNTGTIDAFVRMWLEGEMKVLSQERDVQKWVDASNQFSDGTNATLGATDLVAAADAIDGLTKETDANLIGKNLTYYYGSNENKVSLKELDKGNLYVNPNATVTTQTSPDAYSEVMALQAGGELVYTNTTESKLSFTFAPNQTQTIVSAGYGSGSTAVGGTRYDINGGTTYTVNVTGAALTGSNAGDDIEVVGNVINVKDIGTFYKYLGDNIDTNTFKPKTTGLYIFKRNTDMTNSDASNPIKEDCEFTGYYYVAKTGTDSGADGKYFALQYENNDTAASDKKQRSEYVIPDEAYTYLDDDTNTVTAKNDGIYEFKPTDKLALYTAKQKVIDNDKLTWVYEEGTLKEGTEIEDNGVVYTYTSSKWTKPDGTALNTSDTTEKALSDKLTAAATKPATLTATYYGAENEDVLTALSGSTVTTDTLADGAITTANNGHTSDDISIVVNLNNINSSVAEAWTAIAKANALKIDERTFYYNNDVEEGSTTTKLVDSVELSNATKKEAYLALDFDLNVLMDSIQITIDDNGKESDETIENGWAATGTATKAKGTATNTGSEISSIAWEYTT